MVDETELKKHDWAKAATIDRKIGGHPFDFWVCLRCGRVSPGPTDNEALRPRDDGPCGETSILDRVAVCPVCNPTPLGHGDQDEDEDEDLDLVPAVARSLNEGDGDREALHE